MTADGGRPAPDRPDAGVLVSVIFLAVIVLGAVALPALDACRPG